MGHFMLADMEKADGRSYKKSPYPWAPELCWKSKQTNKQKQPIITIKHSTHRTHVSQKI